MLSHLLDVSVRSLILALVALAFLAIARRRRTAALQHAICATVVCGMLALFLFGELLPRLPLRILNAPAVAQLQAAPADRPPLDIDFPAIPTKPARPQPRTLHWQDLVLYAYFAVALAFLARFVTGLVLARRLLTASRPTPLGDGNIFESSAIAVPVALGSKILLPPDWRDWDTAKLDAVLAHESAHVRRHDSLIAALAGLNRCLFWFHPLAWVLERRLAFLADQACDDASVAQLGDRDGYARVLLEMAALTAGSRGRLRAHFLTMAAPSHVRQRIDALLDDRRTISPGLTRTASTAVLLCAIPLVLFAGIAKLDRQPAPLSLDLAHPAAPEPPVLIAQAQTPSTPLPPTTPRFDDVSVKSCESGDGAGRGGRGGAGGRGIPSSPDGEIYIHCLSIFEIIGFTLDFNGSRILGGTSLLNDPGSLNDPQRIQGGPAWIYTDLWTIDARSTDPLSGQWKTLKGPMVMAMLEDQFRLQTHRKTEEVPMYSLTLAPGGPRLQATEEGGCIPYKRGDPVMVQDMFPANGKPLCIQHGGWKGPNWTIDAAGQRASDLAAMLAGVFVNRPVLDKTGLTDLYTWHLKFAHDQFAPGGLPGSIPLPFTAPTADDPLAPTLNTVLEQELGLTLVPDKGPREFIVVDSAQRPSLR